MRFFKEILKHDYMRNILLIALLTTLGIPGFNLLVVYPSFQKVLIDNTTAEAQRTGRHMARNILGVEMNAPILKLTEEAKTEIQLLEKEYGFYKVRLFSPDGTFIYSTAPEEIGRVNDHSYFLEEVAKGKSRASVVKKGRQSQEGDEIILDVVEIYVPIMSSGGQFLGAFELYYDITEPTNALARAHQISLIVLALGTLLLLIMLLWTLMRTLNSTLELEEANHHLQTTQTQLVEAEKLASLGSLVAGVAHEVNTPIGIGVTASSYLAEITREIEDKINRNDLKKSDFTKYLEQSKEATKSILKNLERSSDLIKNFKQVAVDRSSEEIRNVEICEYIRETLASLKPKFKNKKHLLNFPATDPIEMTTNPGAIAQILTNLVINSLVHGFEEDRPGNILIQVKTVGSQLILTYKDDGKGMDADTLKRIFDPFFTTKRGSGGSGLGMHILYNLITQTLKGSIQVSSEPGRGVFFEIQMPLHLTLPKTNQEV